MKTLKKRSEFLSVAKGGRIARRAFVLQSAKTRSDGDPRMGYTVTKKTGNSVERSRIKRRLRAAVASLDMDIAQIGADYVLVGRRAALSQPFEDLLKDLKGSLRNAFKPRKSRPIQPKPNSLANSKPPHDNVKEN
ncbi:Ribonuclease P protein component [Pseudovibrio axinellae]|uniref:Ribonuclease P protein component n=1 Tax=Pseudovibrio axinellae TaxID=989403 RepID=A0A165ZR77_9HYPH|nr:ribonuclease P protein component [Pseudovibrio axinellae]KZL20194.1 Ribonuclease P protein component [Pseudovibrio axinellae]SEQ60415.1 ribonuclease P protein component [Pseudovibrio axinellae]